FNQLCEIRRTNTSASADIKPFIIGIMKTFGKAKRINQCLSNEKHDSKIGTPCMLNKSARQIPQMRSVQKQRLFMHK
ncbi:hypothetical protein ACQWG3_26270, partial [Salmonella enterica subsp. enterica serovar Infantis]